MKNQKSQSGITLIALVITIIVLLILASITVTYLVSDNGILGSTNQAKYSTTAGQVKDNITAAQGGLQIEFYNPDKTDAEKDYAGDKVTAFMQKFFRKLHSCI